MKEIFYKFLKTWWLPLLFYGFSFFLFLAGTFFRSDTIIDIFLITFFVNILASLISAVVQVFTRRWYYAIVQILVSYFLFNYVVTIFIFSPPDYYGVHKKIPTNIEIYEPLKSEEFIRLPENSQDDNKPLASVHSQDKKTVKKNIKKELEKFGLVLESSHQPGIYKYFTNYKPKETGSFYIKVFEVSSNDKLSAERIKHRSKIKVEKFTPQIYSGEFTIYEGSWGDKYGARIELWFEPSNGKKDYKITQRNYIVEGWMR